MAGIIGAAPLAREPLATNCGKRLTSGPQAATNRAPSARP
jgi:hypothetical protein